MSIGTLSRPVQGVTPDADPLTRDQLLRDAIDRATAYINSSTPLVINVRGMGAAGNGVTDDTAKIQAAIDRAEALVTVDSTPGHVVGAVTIYFPPGRYALSSALTLNASGIRLVGAGSGMSSLVPIAGNGALVIDGAAAYLRHVGVAGLSVDYSGLTVSNSTVAIDIKKCTDTCEMTDVQVVFPQANTNTGLKGISWTDCEHWTATMCWVGWLRGTNSIAYYFDNNGLNRGNMVLTNCLARDAYIGWKNVGSNITNGIVLNSFKHVNSASGATVKPKYAIWVAGQTYGMSIIDSHIEGTQGGSYNYDTGIFLDSTGTAIRDVMISNPKLSRCDVGVDFGSGGGTVQHCRLFNLRFLGTETVTTGFVLGASVSDSWIMGATTQPTVTTWLSDSSVVGAGNLLAWNNAGGAASQEWSYQGRKNAEAFRAARNTNLNTFSGEMYSTSATVTAAIALLRSHSATLNAQSAVQSADVLGQLTYGGSDGSGFQSTARIRAQAAETFVASTALGTALFVSQVLVGTASLVDTWLWNSSGHLRPNADNTYDLGQLAQRVRTIYAYAGNFADTLQSPAVVNQKEPTVDVTIPPLGSLVIHDHLSIAAGKALTIGSGASLVIL